MSEANVIGPPPWRMDEGSPTPRRMKARKRAERLECALTNLTEALDRQYPRAFSPEVDAQRAVARQVLTEVRAAVET